MQNDSHFIRNLQTAAPAAMSSGAREHPTVPGGAAQAGGRHRKDQGLSGGCRASTTLHAECLQGRPADRRASRKQPLQGARILCFEHWTL